MSKPTRNAWQLINVPGSTVSLDCKSVCVAAPSVGSPIDNFIDEVAGTIQLGSPEALQGNNALGRLLVLSLVTSVEGYFRDILFGLTSVCPFAKEKVAEESVQLGALSFYGVDDVAKGIFERVSFASAVEIKKLSKSIGNLTWSENSSLGAAVSSFEQVCHMRHAAVHAKGVLNRGNAKALGVQDRGGERLHLAIDFAHLQNSAAVCLALVREYNQALFERTLDGWRDGRVLNGTWKTDKPHFGRLHRLFYSRIDEVGPTSPYLAWRSVHTNFLRPSRSSETAQPAG